MSSSSSSNNFLNYVIRPDEIYACMWDSATSKLKCPHECACTSSPNSSACQDGYIAIGKQETSPDNNGGAVVHNRRDNPIPFIGWCMNNVNPTYSTNANDKDSWIAGCVSGVRGAHKTYTTNSADTSCEGVANQASWSASSNS